MSRVGEQRVQKARAAEAAETIHPEWQAGIDAITFAAVAPHKDALEALAKAILDAQQPDGKWIDRDTSIINHSAIIALMKSGAFDPESHLYLRLDAGLAASWVGLTDKFQAPEKMEEPLPWLSVMRKARPVVAAFHGAALGRAVSGDIPKALTDAIQSFNTDDGKPRPDGDQGLAIIAGILGTAGLAGATALVHGTPVAAPLEFVAGFVASYIVASFGESYLHDKVHHATPEARDKWKALGPLGKALDRAYLSHSGIHHGATFKKDHVTQFETVEQKEKLTKKLLDSGNKLIVDEDFGTTVKWTGVPKMLAPLTPVYAGLIGTAVLLGAGPAAFAGMGVAAVLMPLASKLMHPYLHMSEEEAMSKASGPMRFFLPSKTGRMISRHHFVHHARQTAREGTNFNITLPIGDKLRGTSSEPTAEELAEMERIKMIK
ncbi:MAG: hypothetical protein IT381_01260 [Deltaproteobacteria bacterium]|nr:hypothetical protein [Deltaproteobacteria bacterium]